MISMTKTRLGTLRCAVDARMGAGAPVSFGAVLGGGDGASWLVQRHQSALFDVRAVELIPPYTADNSTGVSAPPERSP